MKPHNKGLARILCPQGLQFLLIIAIHTTLISLKNLVLAWAIEFLFSSRLIEGLGNAMGVVFLTDVCRATTIEERTPVLLFFNLAQVFLVP